MVADVEMRVESHGSRSGALEVRLLGPLSVSRDGIALPLPGSRKVRALLAYLVLAPRAVTRSQLCELLWDVPNDPRGELRWCLSKLRSVVNEPGRNRIETSADTVRLDLNECFVDAHEIALAMHEGIERIAPKKLRMLAALFTGNVLEGLEIDRSPAFDSWLIAQRRRLRACQTALLERLASGASDNETSAYLETWLELAPFDQRVHEALLNALARQGRVREAEEHLATTARMFEAEGLDHQPVRDAWRAARAQTEVTSRVQPAVPASPATPGATRADLVTAASRRASIAVMPFVDEGPAAAEGGFGRGLASDVITRLAKLRALFVIAQGTVGALHERGLGAEEAGRMLNVDYIVGGSLRRQDRRITVAVELTETRSAHIVWAEIFNRNSDDTFLVLEEIGNKIVASIASEIELIERNRAILRPPNSLDAWEAHHRGLWHMYRFNKTDNELAKHFFETAVRLDPTFSRAYAGLSFTHFQNVFQGWARRDTEIEKTFEIAGQSVIADNRDPAARWAMGRALWLRGQHDQSVIELERAVDLSPNFALAHYNLAFVRSTAGDPSAAISSSDYSRSLSPFDPMLFGMLGARAMALVRLGRYFDAAEWGMKAAARPNAFAHIRAIAAYSLALAGRLDEARSYLATVHETQPRYRVDDLITAMQFDPEGAALFRQAAKRIRSG